MSRSVHTRTFVRSLLVIPLLVLVPDARASSQTLPGEDQCVGCHLTLDDEALRAPAERYENDLHSELGFGCLACHGRGEAGVEGLDPGAGFLSRPDRRRVPRLCGRCHSDAEFMRGFNPAGRVDQEAEYLSSGHGRALMATNDPDVANCVSCHPAHEIRPPDDPAAAVFPSNVAELCAGCHSDEGRMEGRGLATDQFEKYGGSVHGRLMFEDGDLTAPTCNDCHGNHGAAPPGVSSVRRVCGQCHATMAGFFDESAHEELFEAEDLPGCATCHEHHDIQEADEELLGARTETVCLTCHEAGDPDGEAFEAIRALIDSLEAAEEESRAVLEEAENLGMEVSEGFFDLDEVLNALVKARTAIHAFRVGPVQDEVDPGLEATRTALARGEEALYEHWFRRAGLALSAAIVLALILALILKIRNIEIRVEELVTAIELFFRESIQTEAGADVTPEQLRLAACALLIELAYSDEEFSDAEKRHLEELIRRRFDLDPSDAERLLQLAEAEWDRGGGIHEFATLIAERFTEAEKHSLLDAMWGLVLSDGELAEHERRLMAEITDLLELESSWRSQATSGPVRRWMKMFFGAMRRRWAGEGDGFEDLHLAAAALLVELVYADEDFSDVERHHVEGVLQREFGMTASQARQLVELTEAQRDVGFDVRELTSVISSHYGTDQKAALVDAMWGLVLADGELARKERYFMGEVMELMGLEPEWLETRRPPARADTDDGEVNR